MNPARQRPVGPGMRIRFALYAFLLLLATEARADYAWLASWPGGAPASTRLDARFAPPAGFRRVDAEPGSYAAWLRGLPVRGDRSTVLAYDGTPLVRPAAAIVTLDVGDTDVQQCADSILRLRAEYLWDAGRADAAIFRFTSGDRSAWKDWRAGERFRVRGAKVERVRTGRAGAGHGEFRRWLTHLFNYAGTQSLPRDSVAATGELEAGDFFVDPGAPGHAVVLLDVAVHPDGRRVALVGQGFMPAEDFHVLGASGPRVLDGVWFLLPDASDPTLATPSWRPFTREMARRFR